MRSRIAALAVIGIIAAKAGYAQLPSGFQEVSVVSGLSAPTSITFASDGRLFICEKGGGVRVFKQGQLLPTPFVQVNATTNSERGVLGIALDPGFPGTPFVYLYYTTSPTSLNPPPSPKNRVSRFTANGDVAVAGSEVILLDNIASDAGNHNAGCLRFGPGGKLYIATGDGGQTSTNSQNLGNLSGKILRLNKDGTIPADNPFVGQVGKRAEIYCYGLRNPWRFCFRPSTNALYIADVGQNTWEEVNVGQAGGNYGWPTYEGPTSVAGYIGPIYAYNHNGAGASITGGCFINNATYPAAYQGSYFFGDYVTNTLSCLVVTASETLQQAFSFGTAPAPVDFLQGPEGDLYYLSISTGTVRRIQYVGAANRPPVAMASANPTSGPVPLAVSFSSAGSSDPEGDPITYSWDFGDGFTSTQPNPSHTYNAAGTFTATLVVRDNRGGSGQTSLQIRTGNSAPTVAIAAPLDESLYNAGDTIQFRGSATDPEDGPLLASALSWKVTFYHADHTHPFMDVANTASGSFVIPSTGEPSANTWYEICLTARDSAGATTTTCVQIRPRKVRVTFLTSPKGFTITFNGQPVTTPVTIESVVGFQHTIGAPDQQRGSPVYTFASWSDGGAATHTIQAPAADTTYTASFVRAR